MRRGIKSIFLLALACVILAVVFVTTGIVSGGSLDVVREIHFGSTDTMDVQEEYLQDITSLDMECVAGKLQIKEGTGFRIVATNIPKNYYTFYVKDETLHVERKDHDWIHMKWVDWSGLAEDSVITVYVPEGFVAKEIKLDVAAGTVEAETLSAKKAALDIDAGTVKADNVSILEKGTVEVNVGSVTLDGAFKGKVELECNVGTIILRSGNQSTNDFNYKLESNAGSIRINNEEYSNTKEEIQNNAENELDVECNVGSININLK